MSLYRVFPDPRLAIDDSTLEGADTLSNLYQMTGDRSVRLNMVVTPLGETVGADSTSGSLSSGTDRTLVRLLRQQADAVLIGAGTLRAERIPVPVDTPLVILSASGDIAAGNIVMPPHGGDLIIITSSPEVARLALGPLPHRIIPLSPDATSPAEIIGLCQDQGWKHLLLEGGQQTAIAFASAGVIDDLCLTVTGAPREQSTPPLVWWPTTHQWETTHLLTDDQRMLYYRLSRSTSQPD